MRRSALISLVLTILVAAAPASAAPNVVVIETDDQTVADMSVMPRTNTLVGDAGVAFTNSFVSLSECCPSRATFLTGQYAHNHLVRSSRPPFGGIRRLDGSETLAVWLQRAGYATGLVGKYLNGYGAGRGWGRSGSRPWPICTGSGSPRCSPSTRASRGSWPPCARRESSRTRC